MALENDPPLKQRVTKRRASLASIRSVSEEKSFQTPCGQLDLAKNQDSWSGQSRGLTVLTDFLVFPTGDELKRKKKHFRQPLELLSVTFLLFSQNWSYVSYISSAFNISSGLLDLYGIVTK
eukprot:TRINITY_DN8520_c0_g1_i1.p1 TRINITY_DN8520_c0_g1~~TRINITY_DN8520_c0_g1_i1.p1  ORF type:complete len:121 (-),score=1.26 TRINITY_DN8520_c0_g1_i1:40-402(-)